MLFVFFQGFVLGASAAAQPGPFQAFLLSQTIRSGWRRTLPVAFAPLISDGPIVLLVLIALTRAPSWLLYALQIAGGFFLIYLAFGAYRSFRTAVTAEAGEASDSPLRNLLKGALLNALSPNPYIFWATIAGPIFITAWREAPKLGLSFVTGFYVALIGGFMALIGLFSLTERLDARISRALSGLAALALFIFGIFQILQGFFNLRVV